MYCGNCFRDNALVGAFRKMDHHTLMVPLYLPMTLEEDDQSVGTPIFFGGISVYLEQKSALFRKAPRWLNQWLASPALLKWASGRAAKTRAADVAELTLSMIRGEEGHQARELEAFIAWLKTQPKPDIVCLSNALLVGMARRIKSEVGVPVVCMLQGEDSFLDAFPEPLRKQTWETLAERAADVNHFIAPSRYFGDLMSQRLGLAADRVSVVFNGINLEGFSPAATPPKNPTLGYFARMCREKGLDTLVEAYILLRKRDRVKNLKLRIGGGCGPADETFVNTLRERLTATGFLGEVEFCPNVTRSAKQEFLRTLSVFSVPALYGEAFGLYVIEALAAGVLVVQPQHAAFPELIQATGGGVCFEPTSATALADALEPLLLDPAKARAFGEAGRKSVLGEFSTERMAENILKVYEKIVRRK